MAVRSNCQAFFVAEKNPNRQHVGIETGVDEPDQKHLYRQKAA